MEIDFYWSGRRNVLCLINWLISLITNHFLACFLPAFFVALVPFFAAAFFGLAAAFFVAFFGVVAAAGVVAAGAGVVTGAAAGAGVASVGFFVTFLTAFVTSTIS